MHYTKTAIDAFGYELPPMVVYSDELEDRLQPLYRALRFQPGQLEAITGIGERRFWEPGFKMSEGATRAGRKALAASGISTEDIGMLVYAGVCRDNVEPATACAVCHGLGLAPETHIYDVSNACLGVLNGMVQVANAIELGQVKAGLVVSCESAREVVNVTIQRLNETRDMDFFKKNVATLTGGAGAVAVVLADAALSPGGHRLLGGVSRHAAEFHRLCMWGPETEKDSTGVHFIETDALGILTNGVRLGKETFTTFKTALSWDADANAPDKIVCHQVGAAHQRNILSAIGVPASRDFTTFGFLGNIGSVSLPITAAIAAEREFLTAGDRVGFLGIGSGLNCLMLGVNW
jgi:3-oxoacyl-[acyl-carrier-protein] synthase III